MRFLNMRIIASMVLLASFFSGCPFSDKKMVGVNGYVLSKMDSSGIADARYTIYVGDTLKPVNVCWDQSESDGRIRGGCPYWSEEDVDTGWIKIVADTLKYKKFIAPVIFDDVLTKFYLDPL